MISKTFNIYCDESCHIENNNQKSMLLGAIWTPFQKKGKIFNRLAEIKKSMDSFLL